MEYFRRKQTAWKMEIDLFNTQIHFPFVRSFPTALESDCSTVVKGHKSICSMLVKSWVSWADLSALSAPQNPSDRENCFAQAIFLTLSGVTSNGSTSPSCRRTDESLASQCTWWHCSYLVVRLRKVTPDRRRPSFHDAEHRTISLHWQNESCVDILRTKSSKW